jgi:Fic family protein
MYLSITRQTASKYLKQLSLIGLLEEQKIGKAKYYINKNFVEVLSK